MGGYSYKIADRFLERIYGGLPEGIFKELFEESHGGIYERLPVGILEVFLEHSGATGGNRRIPRGLFEEMHGENL